MRNAAARSDDRLDPVIHPTLEALLPGAGAATALCLLLGSLLFVV